MSRRIAFTLVAALALLAALAGPGAAPAAAATTYTVMTLTANGYESSPFAINAAGLVVGYSYPSAILWRNGIATNLGVPGEVLSQAIGINTSGQVVGFSATDWGNQYMRASLWQDGAMTDLNDRLPPGSSTQLLSAYGINDAGQMVGSAYLPDSGSYPPFLLSGGTLTLLPTLPGGRDGAARAINNAGQIVGRTSVVPGGAYHAALWQGGALTDLGTLGGDNSDGFSISDTGQVVGWAQTAGGDRHAFLWQNGRMTDLGTLPGYEHSVAYGINTAGQVVGWVETAASGGDITYGGVHAVLWENGAIVDLNSRIPAGTALLLAKATAINDNGQIVGQGLDLVPRNDVPPIKPGFLLTPAAPVDTTPPDTQIVDGPGGWIRINGAAFTVSGSDAVTPTANLLYSYRLDNGPWSAFSGSTTIALTNLVEGPHTLAVAAKDEAGNVDPTPATQGFSVDTVAPAITCQLPDGAWHADNQTFACTAQDDGSGLANPGDASFTLSTDVPPGAESASASTDSRTVSDVAGNRSPAGPLSPVKVDRKAPVTTASATADGQPYSADTWSMRDVAVSLSATDGGVGVAGTYYTINGGAQQSYTGALAFSSDGVYALQFWSVDNLGNAEVAQGLPIKLDMTKPSINCPTVPAGWQADNVTLTCTASDGGSGIPQADQSFSLSTSVAAGAEDAAAQTGTKTLTDAAGNSAIAGPYAAMVDRKAPTTQASAKKADNSSYTDGTWSSQDVTVTLSASDAGSGVAAITYSLGANAPVTVNAATATLPVFSVDGVTTISYYATDNVGNKQAATTFTVEVDKTAPTISASAKTADGQPYTSGTWTNQTVTVAFTCGDAASGVPAGCPAAVVIDTTTAAGGQNVSASVVDAAGNPATSNTIVVKIDKVAPTLNPSLGATQAGAVGTSSGTITVWLRANATATAGASDSPSGIASQSCGPVDTSGVGPKSLTCTTTDGAGNTVNMTVNYRVIYRFDGFLQPINDTAHPQTCGTPCPLSVFNAGGTVPVKFQLKDAAGNVVQAGSLPAWETPTNLGRTTAPIDESPSTDPGDTGGTYRWDPAAQQYVYNDKTASSQAGNLWRVGVRLDDNMLYTVDFGLR
jgi:probable HAF family extracellular repeat protein